MTGVFAAVDIGASGGRVIAGWIADGTIVTDVVHRFANGPSQSESGLRWDIRTLYEEVLTGFGLLAQRYPRVVSIGIDTWAVDYGLLDADGELIEDPHCYREPRTADAVRQVQQWIAPADLYAITGLQHLSFNTIYQLVAEHTCPAWERAQTILMLPDLLGYWLTGELGADVTNASSTALLDASARDWSGELLTIAGVRPGMLPGVQPAGTIRGHLRPDVLARTGLPADVVLTSIGSHDTASAVVGVPATEPGFGYISSGTWSLVGVETPEPILTEASRAANFTNEGGVDRRIRYLRNEGGLWLLQESVRQWQADGLEPELADLLAQAAALPAGGPTVDVGAEEFIAPDRMPERIAEACRRDGQSVPRTQAEFTRCILDSLAIAYQATIQAAEDLSGQPIERIHVVGGGSQNRLLCQLTANATGRPVIAGPVEATALGNLLVQARTHGEVAGSLEDLRVIVAASSDLTSYVPRKPTTR